ncbi:MAG: hypothetical protein AB1698_21705 [Pseudomonadota bacterium]
MTAEASLTQDLSVTLSGLITSGSEMAGGEEAGEVCATSLETLTSSVTQVVAGLPLCLGEAVPSLPGGSDEPSSGGSGGDIIAGLPIDLGGLGSLTAPLTGILGESGSGPLGSITQPVENLLGGADGPLNLGDLGQITNILGDGSPLGNGSPLGTLAEPVNGLLNGVGGTLQSLAPELGTTLGSVVDSVAGLDLIDSGLTDISTPVFNTLNDTIMDVHFTLEVLSYEVGIPSVAHNLTDLGETIGLGKIGEDNLVTDILETPAALLTGGDALNLQETLTHVGDILETAPSLVTGLGEDLTTNPSLPSLGNVVESVLEGGGYPSRASNDYLIHLSAGEQTDQPLLSLHPLSTQPDHPQYIDIGLIDIPQGTVQVLAANLIGPSPDGPGESNVLPAIDLFAGPETDHTFADLNVLAPPSKDGSHPLDVGVLTSFPPTQLLVADLREGKLSGGLVDLLAGESSQDSLANLLDGPAGAPAAGIDDLIGDVTSLPALGDLGALVHGTGDTPMAAHGSGGGLGLV